MINSTPCGSASTSIRSTPAAHSFIGRAQAFFLQQTGDPVACTAAGLAGAGKSAPAAGVVARLFRQLLDLRRRDVLAPDAVVLLMKRSVAEKGARIGAE